MAKQMIRQTDERIDGRKRGNIGTISARGRVDGDKKSRKAPLGLARNEILAKECTVI